MAAGSTPPGAAAKVGPRLRPLGASEGLHTTSGEVEKIFTEHHPGLRTDRIRDAWRFAASAHEGVLRRSGDPYISHPVEVAGIAADLGLDEASVCAALLHDVVEDTDASLDDIVALWPDDPDFGADVAVLVDGLTKLDGLRFSTEVGRKAADLRRLLANIARDPRVLVVKLSDRLHNMRTLSVLSESKQHRIASETLEVYAPLAHRLGIGSVRSELEDLCFATLEPELFAAVSAALDSRRTGLTSELDELLARLTGALDGAGISARVMWRLKHAWGIHEKMLRSGRPFDEILDVVGVRVVVETVPECYMALGVVHGLWSPLPNTFDDYIANPRLNLYRSLHTTVAGPSGRAVEVQVRTSEMHEVAEYGVAAHWAYKEGADAVAEVAWMRRLLEVSADDEESYLTEVHGELHAGEIYCLTPKGTPVALPSGATPIDFAYQIHTEVGDRAVGARVDGRLVGLDWRLSDGDRVEIVTSSDENRGPNPAWADWVATPKARQLIKRWHTRARRHEAAGTGRVRIAEAVEARARRAAVPVPTDLDSGLVSVASRWGLRDADSVAAAVGDGRISVDAVAARLVPLPSLPRRPRPAPAPASKAVLIEDTAGIEVSFAACCDPEPPAPIVGWVSRRGGVSVHRTDCSNIGDLVARDDARIIAAHWEDVPKVSLAATVIVSAFDRSGLVVACASVFAHVGADILSVAAATENGLARQEYRINVSGRTALEELTKGLWAVPGVVTVDVSTALASS